MRWLARLVTSAALVLLIQGCSPTGQKQDPVPAPAASEAPAEAPIEVSAEVSAREVASYDSATHGALQVRSVAASPGDWFDVLRDGIRAIPGSPPLLGTIVELEPGSYVVDVNRTRREVTIEVGELAILWTGELQVDGEPESAYWYPMQESERRLSSNPPLLNRAVALFPGSYTVFVHVSVTEPDLDLGEAVVEAGRKTLVRR